MRRGLAVAGLLLVLGGVVGFFVVVVRMPALVPAVRDAVANWVVIASGLLLSMLAVRQAGAGRWLARVLLGVNVALAGLFAAFLYVVLALPSADGPPIGAPAPDWALRDQAGTLVRLADFRGAPLLLVFYRGHW